MVLRLVTSIDSRLKAIETGVGTINEIKKDLLLMSAKVREIEISVTDTKKSQIIKPT